MKYIMKTDLINRYKKILPKEYDDEVGDFLKTIEGKMVDLVFTGGDAFEKNNNNIWLPNCLWYTVNDDFDCGNISDGYHTFNELYDHRCALFIALMRSNPEISWRANNHDDGSSFDGWFIAGMHLPSGDITYHLPIDKWNLLDNKCIQTSLRAPKWDGHTPADVVERLLKWSLL